MVFIIIINNNYYIFILLDLTKPSIKVHPMNSIIIRSSNILLTCQATGYPSITFIWFFNSSPLQEASNQLSLTNISQVNDGSYVCQVKNSLGELQSDTEQIVTSCKILLLYHIRNPNVKR